MKYDVYLEISQEAINEGGYLAHIPAVPGCVGRGKTISEAVARCRETLKAYLALLISKGVQGLPSPKDPIELVVHETEDETVPPDYVPLAASEAEQQINWLEINRADVLQTVAELPPDALDWKPATNEWSINQILRHVAGAEWWYVLRLQDWPADLSEYMAATRQLLVSRLQNLTEDERKRVTRHYGADWTPRKVARRALEHEREHLQQIRDNIALYLERTKR
jgi:predicted RNase H-like HicB family nuclease